MEFTGELKDISRDWKTNEFNITFSMNGQPNADEIDNLKERGFDDIVDEISTTYDIVPSLATLHGIDTAIDDA